MGTVSDAVETKLSLDFSGPYSWPGLPGAPSLFTASEARVPGVYLWAVPTPEGYLVYYVGETGRSFGVRFLEHYEEHCAGFYHLYEPAAFASGAKVLVWPGRYDATNRKSVLDCISSYLELAPTIAALTCTYQFFLAPLVVEARLRKRVEAAIANALYRAPGLVGAFQDAGVSYSPRGESESPVLCTVRSSATILGLSESLLV